MLKFPFEINDISDALNRTLLDYFKGERDGFVQVGPSKYFFPKQFKKNAESYYNFQARPSDIWVSTFPRSGTTWTQELVWLIGNNLDFERAKNELLTSRFPFFEFNTFMHPQVKQELLQANKYDEEHQNFIHRISQSIIPYLDGMSEQRFIKTHLPLSLMPPSVFQENSKIIYVARNPKDVALSYYHLNRLYKTQGYIGEFEFYWRIFKTGLNAWLPYWDHLEEAWGRRTDPNILFIFYEEMNNDIRKTINRISSFMGRSYSKEQVEQLAEHLNIKSFKCNNSVNGLEMRKVKILNEREGDFIRNGIINGSDYELTPELQKEMNKWISENLEKSGIIFPDF
ncbi:hypothetical protein ACFFRR_001369 [Megaselia abdita]